MFVFFIYNYKNICGGIKIIDVGDKVETDEVVLEIETDKVTVDVRAPEGGFIAQFYSDVDTDVEVGTPLFSLSSDPVDASNIPDKPAAPAAPAASTTPKSEQDSTPSSNTQKSEPETQSQSSSSQTPVSTIPHRIPSIQFRHGDRGIYYKHSDDIFIQKTLVRLGLPFWMFELFVLVFFVLSFCIAAIDEIVRGTSSPLEPSLTQSEAITTQNFEFFNLPGQLKRKSWTEEEIDAVNVSLCLKR